MGAKGRHTFRERGGTPLQSGVTHRCAGSAGVASTQDDLITLHRVGIW